VQDQIPVVVSLHRLDYAKEFADRIIGLTGGDVVFDGSPAQLSESALAQIYGDHDQNLT
jgi:phosphonate transport system ATP-binding protein